jgi:hypothetical protein
MKAIQKLRQRQQTVQLQETDQTGTRDILFSSTASRQLEESGSIAFSFSQPFPNGLDYLDYLQINRDDMALRRAWPIKRVHSQPRTRLDSPFWTV